MKHDGDSLTSRLELWSERLIATIQRQPVPPPPQTRQPPSNETRAIYDVTLRLLTRDWNNKKPEERRPWYIHWIENQVFAEIRRMKELGLWPFESTPGRDTIQRRIREMQDSHLDWSGAAGGVPPLFTFGEGWYIFSPLRFQGEYRVEVERLAAEGRQLLEGERRVE